jgi:hypothetical protein
VVEADRRQALVTTKLTALVTAGWGTAALDEPGRSALPFPGGAGVRAGATGWVLAEGAPARSLGPALLWARRAGVDRLHLLVEEEAGRLARRATAFTRAPQVWQVRDRTVTLAAAEPISPAPRLGAEASAWADRLRAAGAEPVVEAGVLTGEVLGLEVARVVSDAEGSRLEVGVGKHDRHAQRIMGGEVPTDDALAAAVAAVREHRRAGAPHHPLNRLASERWLRALVVERPALVGAAHLVVVPSPVTRDDLRRHAPAPAAGVDEHERPLLVVCSTGIDLDLVPAAADARLADGRDPRLVLVVPDRDDHPVHRSLSALLVEPAEVRTVPDDWRSLASLP